MSAEAAAVLLVFSIMPDEAAAQKLARHLVEKKLAACVNVLSPCVSTYRWRGVVEEAREVPVIIKATAAAYPALEAAIRDVHPYELPEIVAVPLVHGFPAYLDWVTAATGAA
ncbi:MAG: Divalent-cation tolerance protein [Pseudomonadota bacterium]|jgi:periplasmic divalent cation tolerance protein